MIEKKNYYFFIAILSYWNHNKKLLYHKIMKWTKDFHLKSSVFVMTSTNFFQNDILFCNIQLHLRIPCRVIYSWSCIIKMKQEAFKIVYIEYTFS